MPPHILCVQTDFQPVTCSLHVISELCWAITFQDLYSNFWCIKKFRFHRLDTLWWINNYYYSYNGQSTKYCTLYKLCLQPSSTSLQPERECYNNYIYYVSLCRHFFPFLFQTYAVQSHYGIPHSEVTRKVWGRFVCRCFCDLTLLHSVSLLVSKTPPTVHAAARPGPHQPISCSGSTWYVQV